MIRAIIGAPDLDGTKMYPLLISLHGRSQNNENGKKVNRWTKIAGTPEVHEWLFQQKRG